MALLLGFVIRLIIARYGSEADYGIYSLAIVIMMFAVTLVSLGLPEGVARFIAYFRGKGETGKVKSVTAVALQLTIFASLISGVALFFSAEYVAASFFHTPELARALKIFAIGIPFYALINILVSAFRGFDRMEPQAYFQYILFNALFLLLVGAMAVLNLAFVNLFYVYVAALVLTFLALLWYTAKKLPQPIGLVGWKANAHVRKELLAFSLPLLVTALLAAVMLWTDTLLLGYFKTPEIVGLYNAASPLARFIGDPMGLMLLIFTPVATGLYAQNKTFELRRSFIISTKWLVSLTLPFFLVLFLFPEAVLNLFFGAAYVSAAPALRILSLGFIISNLFGPNQSIVLAAGESGFVMWTALGAAVVSVVLNFVLIPPLGIVGAATATIFAIIVARIIIGLRAYRLYKIQPMSRNLLKPIVFSIILALLFKYATYYLATITWWILLLFFILYYGIYGLAIVLTRSFDHEDIALLLEIEKISGINASPIKKVLKRFL